MQIYASPLSALLAMTLAGCVMAADPAYPVTKAIRSASSLNGQVVRVRGVLKPWHSGMNLYSETRNVCIGLLVPNGELPLYRSRQGQRVTVSGKLEAEGCGRDGICDEHLCGPAVMSSVRLVS